MASGPGQPPGTSHAIAPRAGLRHTVILARETGIAGTTFTRAPRLAVEPRKSIYYLFIYRALARNNKQTVCLLCGSSCSCCLCHGCGAAEHSLLSCTCGAQMLTTPPTLWLVPMHTVTVTRGPTCDRTQTDRWGPTKLQPQGGVYQDACTMSLLSD